MGATRPILSRAACPLAKRSADGSYRPSFATATMVVAAGQTVVKIAASVDHGFDKVFDNTLIRNINLHLTVRIV